VSATLVELADAVVDVLNESSVQDTLGRTFTAKRAYVPEVKLEDAEKGLHVFVVPMTMATSNLSRNQTLKQPVVNVGFLCRVPSDYTNQWLDELMNMMEAAGDHFMRLSFTMDAGDRVKCVSAEVPAPYDYDGLREQKTFRSFLSLTFRRDNG
jgi:hypothetical protein